MLHSCSVLPVFLISMFSFSFFFSCSGVHRDLHSFPTRRSSDLLRPAPRVRVEVHAADRARQFDDHRGAAVVAPAEAAVNVKLDRKSTRLNSSHVRISYAVFCLKKKKIKSHIPNYILRQYLVRRS